MVIGSHWVIRGFVRSRKLTKTGIVSILRITVVNGLTFYLMTFGNPLIYDWK